MTLLTFDIPTLADSQLPGSATLVQAHLTIAINLASRADVTASSALATPTHRDEEPLTAQIAPRTEPQPTAQIDDLVSDDDEFTSVPSATAAAAPVIGDLGPTSVQTDGIGNGHTTLVG
jgi:hypothetical protein